LILSLVRRSGILTQTIVTLGELTEKALLFCNPELEITHFLFLLTRHGQLRFASTKFLIDALVCWLKQHLIRTERWQFYFTVTNVKAHTCDITLYIVFLDWHHVIVADASGISRQEFVTDLVALADCDQCVDQT
jgi:hypothetical protein